MLRAAGLRVGLYTSAQLHHITERISTVHTTPLASQWREALVQHSRQEVFVHHSRQEIFVHHSRLDVFVHHSRPAIELLREDPRACPSHFEILTAPALRCGGCS